MVLKEYRATYHQKGIRTNYPSNRIIKATSGSIAMKLARKELGNKYVVEGVMRR